MKDTLAYIRKNLALSTLIAGLVLAAACEKRTPSTETSGGEKKIKIANIITEQEARVAAAQTQISIFSTALDAFEVNNGYYPKGEEGLNALVKEPSDSKTWKGPYLRQGIPTDPWGQPYVYEYPGKHNNKGYDLMCPGPDGQTGTEDDITNWEAGK